MNNSGIGFIVGNTFCACSDDAVFDVEKDIIPGGDKKNLQETKTIKLNAIFECVGRVVKGEKVFCLFKSGEIKEAFVGTVRGKSGDLTVIDIIGKSPYINEIITKIKFLIGGN